MTEADHFGASSTNDARYRLLVDAVSDYAIFMLDPDGIVASWNPGAERFHGYRATDIIGQNFSLFYTPDDQRAGLPARVLNIAASEGRFETEGWRVRKDGSRFWTHVIIDPIKASSGEIVGYAKITRDLTEQETRGTGAPARRRTVQNPRPGVTDYSIYTLSPTGTVSNWNLGGEEDLRVSSGRDHRQEFCPFLYG